MTLRAGGHRATLPSLKMPDHKPEPTQQGPFHGTVKKWSDDLGWGVLVAPGLPGTVFAHHIHIRGQGDGYRTFKAGTSVIFEIDESDGQDGCEHRARWVEAAPATPLTDPEEREPIELPVAKERQIEGLESRAAARSVRDRPKD
jgi:cold shock protein